ncbi:hypothetical protein CC86DRAFT_187362 [Ophiobolus disseminans]|uniref:Uncharacterized protein n=1 Tax=Ophiobolus disseminans TaxID=1469910 RepID=A0A6A7A8X1_9PLEO|nr:hypothetical protein CC86DRAFT_187362 [Ophiobolus disseminans]
MLCDLLLNAHCPSIPLPFSPQTRSIHFASLLTPPLSTRCCAHTLPRFRLALPAKGWASTALSFSIHVLLITSFQHRDQTAPRCVNPETPYLVSSLINCSSGAFTVTPSSRDPHTFGHIGTEPL